MSYHVQSVYDEFLLAREAGEVDPKALEPVFEDFREYFVQEPRERTGFYVTDYGSCMRGVYLQRKGTFKPAPFEARTLRNFLLGRSYEAGILAALSWKGILEGSQLRVEWPDLNLSGRCDALLDDGTVVEIKSQHSRAFHWARKSGGGAQDHHVAQVLSYMQGLEKNLGAVVYGSKDDGTMMQFPIMRNMELEGQILDYFSRLKHYWDSEAVPPPAESVLYDPLRKKWAVNWKAKYCRLHEFCTGDPKWLIRAEATAKDKNNAK